MASVYTLGASPQKGLCRTAWKAVKRDFLNLATFRDAWSARKI